MTTFNLAELAASMNTMSGRSEAQHLLRNTLKEFGANELGSGAFGTVYQHPTDSNRVIKFSTNRDAYYMFVRWCMLDKNKGNKFLPVFHSEHVINVGGRIGFVHEMEHLERPLTQKAKNSGRGAPSIPSHVPNIIIGTFWRAAREITADNQIGWNRNGFTNKFPTRLSFIKELRAIANKQHNRDSDEWPMRVNVKEIRIAKQFIDLMYDMFTDFSGVANLDFHGGNIMMRKGKRFATRRNGTVVITDPVSEIYSSFCRDVADGNMTSAINQWLENINDEKYINNVNKLTLKNTANARMATFTPMANIVAYGGTTVGYQYTAIAKQKKETVDMTQFYEAEE